MYQSWFKTKNVCVKCYQGPLPHSVYLHWRHSHDKMNQTSPLHFCTLQVIKTGRWEGLATRLRQTYSVTLYFAILSFFSGVPSLRRRVTCPSYGRGKTLFSLVPRPHSKGGRTKSWSWSRKACLWFCYNTQKLIPAWSMSKLNRIAENTSLVGSGVRLLNYIFEPIKHTLMGIFCYSVTVEFCSGIKWVRYIRTCFLKIGGRTAPICKDMIAR